MSFFSLENNNSKKRERKREYLLVMEYANNGTLQEYLKEHFDDLTWNDKFDLALQLAYAVSCLHDEGIVHRDLVVNLHFINIIFTIIITYFTYWVNNSTLVMYWFIKIPLS